MKALNKWISLALGICLVSSSVGAAQETPASEEPDYVLKKYEVLDITLPVVEKIVTPPVPSHTIGAKVTMLFSVTDKGIPINIRAKGWPLHAAADLSATMQTILRSWRFKPALDEGGYPIAVKVALPVEVVRKKEASQAIASIDFGNLELIRRIN